MTATTFHNRSQHLCNLPAYQHAMSEEIHLDEDNEGMPIITIDVDTQVTQAAE